MENESNRLNPSKKVGNSIP